MPKQVLHAGRQKGLSSGNANENERRGWTEATVRAKNQDNNNCYDWSRHRLNFEVVDGKIKALGSQEKPLYQRYKDKLASVGYEKKDAGASNEQNTYVELILSGDTEHMRELAFGWQTVSYERNPKTWRNWEIERVESIEQFALDSYDFCCRRFGKENVIGFEVHLDENSPHIHVNIVPTATIQQSGRVSGYIEIDSAGNPAVYTRGKHLGERKRPISDKDYQKLSDEKKKRYRKNERNSVRTISYAALFGSTKEERSLIMEELHTQYYEEVGASWGLERGECWRNLTDEERLFKKKHLTKEQHAAISAADKTLKEQQKKISENQYEIYSLEGQKRMSQSELNENMLITQDLSVRRRELAAEMVGKHDWSTLLKKFFSEAIAAIQAILDRIVSPSSRAFSKYQVETIEASLSKTEARSIEDRKLHLQDLLNEAKTIVGNSVPHQWIDQAEEELMELAEGKDVCRGYSRWNRQNT